MTYTTTTPPTEPGWYYVEWSRSKDPAYLDGTGIWRDSTLDADTQVKGLIPPDRYGPRIPSAEELEAMEECVKVLRKRKHHNDTCSKELLESNDPNDCTCGHDSGLATLAKLDELRAR